MVLTHFARSILRRHLGETQVYVGINIYILYTHAYIYGVYEDLMIGTEFRYVHNKIFLKMITF